MITYVTTYTDKRGNIIEKRVYTDKEVKVYKLSLTAIYKFIISIFK